MDRSQVEKISKALADQTRLMIFEAISAKDHVNCSELVAKCVLCGGPHESFSRKLSAALPISP